jgi:hypothetical protein
MRMYSFDFIKFPPPITRRLIHLKTVILDLFCNSSVIGSFHNHVCKNLDKVCDFFLTYSKKYYLLNKVVNFDRQLHYRKLKQDIYEFNKSVNSSPSLVKPKTTRLVFAASLLSTQHYRVRAKTGWIRIGIKCCASGATCLFLVFCFSELALWKSN